jgi:spore germination cell wall hydrolase CwlJ-like protein
MKFIFKRTGALASVGILATSLLGAIAAGAYAQDQAVADVSAIGSTAAEPAENEAEAEIRFVATPVVQALPDQGETDMAAPAPTSFAGDSLADLVASVDTSGALSNDMQCLAQTIYFEARGEPLAGQLAVARVVINRAASSSFPDDYCSVVTQRAQFSFVRGGRLPEPNRDSEAWQRAKAIARIAHRNMWQSEADDALYFHATYVRPRWARKLQARATIDRHIFYR